MNEEFINGFDKTAGTPKSLKRVFFKTPEQVEKLKRWKENIDTFKNHPSNSLKAQAEITRDKVNKLRSNSLDKKVKLK